MLIFVNFNGDPVPMQIPVDITIGEFKQLMQLQFGVQVGEQRIEGLPHGCGDGAEVGTAMADSDMITLSRMDYMEEQQRAEELVSMEEARMMGSVNIINSLRNLRTGTSGTPQFFGNDETFIDESTSDAQVDSALGESLSRIVWTQLNAQPSITTALGDARRNRSPLICIIYSVSNLKSVEMLGMLSHKLEDPENKALTNIFSTWMADVNTAQYDAFLKIIENNQSLQDQLSPHTPQIPIVAVLVPVSGGEMKLVKPLIGNVLGDDFFNTLLHVIADHSDRLDIERAATEVSENKQIKDDISEALQQAMLEDSKKEAEERDRSQREEREQEAAEAAVRKEQTEILEKRMKIEERRESRLVGLGIEPAASADTVELMVKLPNGSGITRRFQKTNKLETVFWFLDLHEDIREQFEDTDTCKLVMTYPRKSLDLATHGALSLVDLSLTGKVALFVQ
eukprot:TRINITY_DN37615_c0_g1_i1.p1 TRINITY_DN37615_c0_g1~~TRINITY_DN37615_c0_g1_i1.p1  ORF type:complete len:453 (+),score=91.42 TRINITY_DN37615_c0_g1_i1:56-1414(+)